ncbi:MAG: hypothetical protein ACT6R7_16860 [Brevundimonas aurantiaca]|jgi:hypothetical protein|uniref:hypothetical protein n=1 Tax=Brevundimonas aurantiaca TaxID=74316 RepID=UPI004034CD5A
MLSDPEDPGLRQTAKNLVEVCFRNSCLEDLHAGTTPASMTGDYTDVVVKTPYGDIPWNTLSRLSDDEMRRLMIEVVDRVYTFLVFNEQLNYGLACGAWQQPKLHPGLMASVARRMTPPTTT